MDNKLDLDIIEDTISECPLLAFDLIIQSSRSKNNSEAALERINELTKMCIVTLAEEDILSNKDLTKHVIQVLSKTDQIKNRQALSASLLRLLAESNMDWLAKNPYRRHIVQLFDSQFTDLYAARKIKQSLQAHEKIEPLRQMLHSHDKTLKRALMSVTSLDLRKKSLQNIMKALNSKFGNSIARPFLPDDISARLRELFKRIDNYMQLRDNPRIVDAYENVSKGCRDLIHQSENYRTIYCHWIADYVGKRLLEFIEADFKNNKVTQPSTISIKTIDKKYPFHLVDQEITLGFIVFNEGPGFAHNISLDIVIENGPSIENEKLQINRLAPSVEQQVNIPTRVETPIKEISIFLEFDWHNFRGERQRKDELFTLFSQRSDIDWSSASQSDPYSLEAIINETDFIGRKDIINSLLSTSTGQLTGSSIIYGQKRVGKTSIARALESQLLKVGYKTIYLEGGDYVHPKADTTITQLGEKLSRKIIESDSRLTQLPIPKFDVALSPLSDLLDEVYTIAPDIRFVILLDEFDELPTEIYERSPLGDAFFLSVRSLSARSFLGFVLIGGEKMAHILDIQGDQLNRWKPRSVDYFDRTVDWIDYCELIKRPALNFLEFTQDAIIALHEVTAGNPYFTKLVCQQIFEQAIDRRDCYITQTEVKQAIDTTVEQTEINNFQHFWEDGITDSGQKGEEKSIRRRKILIAISDTLQHECPVRKTSIEKHELISTIPSLDADLQEFVSRKILIHDHNLDTYTFKVKLFHLWLKTRGVYDVITRFADLDAALQRRRQEEELKVKPKEILELVERWGLYKATKVSDEKVRAWLEQFSEIEEQRIMFSLLKNIRFYREEFIREKLKEAHQKVIKGLTLKLTKAQTKRTDILVSYLDSPSKSSSHLTRYYQEISQIHSNFIIEKGKLLERLQNAENNQYKKVKTLVFLDDFVGTGQSACASLKEIDDQLSDVILERGIRVLFVAVVALLNGLDKVQNCIDDLDTPVHILKFEILNESDQCFSDKSIIFPNLNEREKAKKIAYKYGKPLMKSNPLGYGNSQLAIVFEHACPNNTLPILWAKSSKWIPLFERH